MFGVIAALALIALVACSPPADPPPPAPTALEEQLGDEAPDQVPPAETATPTPTPVAAPTGPTATPEPADACAGFSGSLEVQVLIGPSDAVGLEPVAVGAVPIAAAGATSPHPVSGQTYVTYQDALVEEWGSFTVYFDADIAVDGTCTDTNGVATLDLEVTMTGSQLVEVRSEGFNADYPWEGTYTLPARMPAEDGASVEGEGFAFTLRLN